jgi:type IV conjugative transfer system coupling protein TraD
MVDRGPRPLHPQAWSSHGEANRNSGNFTRGSQLLGHQFSMWWRGVRLPVMVWAGLLLLFFTIRMMMTLGQYEWQMIGQKLLATLLLYLDISEMKRVDITLRDGSLFQTYMGYVPFIPDVQTAWAKLINAFLGSFIFSTMTTALFVYWYVPWARKRGETILADHHERGVELVEYGVLRRLIVHHNSKELRERAQEMFPDHSAAEVASLPFATRKQAGLAPPYMIASLPFTYGSEQSHVMAVGTTGSGKTTVLRSLVAQAIERGDKIVLFDLTGHYVEAFYNQDRDYILNLNDQRCESWSVFNDCETQSEFVAAATALIPAEYGSDGGFWERAARTLFVEMCVKLKSLGLTSNKALSDELLKASLKHIYSRLRGTVADPLTSPDAAKMAQSIRAVLNAHGDHLRFLPDGGPPFSIKKWIKREDEAPSILFITASYSDLDMAKPLLTMWMNIAINTLMTLKHTRVLRTWYIFDELAALHKLPALERGLQTARSFGGAFVLGLHNFAGLRVPYGDDGASNIISLTNTKLFLRVAHTETAEECSRLIGTRKVRSMDESYSYGAHQTRDASTISPTTKEEALVIADDLTSLPNLTGYIRFPGKFPSAMVTIPYVNYKVGAQGFIPNEPPPLLILDKDDGDDDSGGQGEGGGPDIVELHPESDMPSEEAPRDNVVYLGSRKDIGPKTESPTKPVKLSTAISTRNTPRHGRLSIPKKPLQSTDGNAKLAVKESQKNKLNTVAPSAKQSHRQRAEQVEESNSGKLAKHEAQQDFSEDATKLSRLASRDGDELDHDI